MRITISLIRFSLIRLPAREKCKDGEQLIPALERITVGIARIYARVNGQSTSFPLMTRIMGNISALDMHAYMRRLHVGIHDTRVRV